jgi:hypothetical protein
MSLLPPPEAVYPDPTTAFNAIQLYAKGQGYAFIKLNKKPSRLLFACDRSGNYDSKGKDPTVDKSKQRKNTGSKKCGCLMKVGLHLDRLSNQWILEVLYKAHNHGPSAAPTAHPAHRIAAITLDTRAHISGLSHNGLTISQILSTLRTTYPKLRLLAKDISNIVQQNRAEQLNGMTPIAWLLEVRIRPLSS